MSFKVGDKVVFKEFQDRDIYRLLGWRLADDLACIECHKGFVRKVHEDHLRHATPAEITAGHRIDHCVEATKKVELFGNSEGLEVLEMIDVSPNCEVSEI